MSSAIWLAVASGTLVEYLPSRRTQYRCPTGCRISSMRCVRPPRCFRLTRMSAGSLGTHLTLQMLQALSGWYDASKSRINQAVKIQVSPSRRELDRNPTHNSSASPLALSLGTDLDCAYGRCWRLVVAHAEGISRWTQSLLG